MILFVVNSKYGMESLEMHHHTERFFKDQCTDEALEEVLTWFQTPKGNAFLSHQIKKDLLQLTSISSNDLQNGNIPTEKIFNRIQQSKEDPGRTLWILKWLSSAFVIAMAVYPLYEKSVGMYGMLLAKGIGSKIFSLSDGYLC